MDIRNCKRCGTVFPYQGIPICNSCKRQDEEDFLRVKKFLEEHPNTTLLELSNELEISVEKVKKFLKEGRLEAIGANLMIECEACGKLIKNGRYCEECQNKTMKNLKGIAKDMMASQKPASSKKTGGFYFKNKG